MFDNVKRHPTIIFIVIIIVSISSFTCGNHGERSTRPIQYGVAADTTIRDTYFSIHSHLLSLGQPSEGFGGRQVVDYVFQTLPEKISIPYQKGSKPPKSADRTALSQTIATTEEQSFSMHFRYKDEINKLAWIAVFFPAVFLLIAITALIAGKLEPQGKKNLVPLLIVTVALSAVVYITGSYNSVYFDNATDKEYIIRIDEKEIVIPPKKHVRVSLDTGPHSFSSFLNEERGAITEAVIEVVRSDLLVYNIEGYNDYEIKKSAYRKSH